MNLNTFLLLGGAATALALAGCGEKETITTSTPDTRGETRIVEYCSGEQYYPTKEFFRASGAGTSPQREIAKKIARQNAEATLARSIQVTVETVIENQATQLGVTKEEATTKFNEFTRTIANQQLTGAITICQELTQAQDGTYIAYLAIELSGAKIADAYIAGLKQEERIRAEYNYDQFKNTFEQVMEQYRNK
jgi:hypothetical protein